MNTAVLNIQYEAIASQISSCSSHCWVVICLISWHGANTYLITKEHHSNLKYLAGGTSLRLRLSQKTI